MMRLRLNPHSKYKKLTGKSDEELQRIFEKEMRLGVLSTQNLLYPFPGEFLSMYLVFLLCHLGAIPSFDLSITGSKRETPWIYNYCHNCVFTVMDIVSTIVLEFLKTG